MPSTMMLNARFCQKRLLRISGKEICRQAVPLVPPLLVGQPRFDGMAAVRLGELCIVTSPAACGVEVLTGSVQLAFCGSVGSGCGVQPGGGIAAKGAPRVLKSTPADAVVSLDTTVLLMNFTFNASCSE